MAERLFGFIGGTAAESYRQRMMAALELGPVKGLRALDLGCGEGEEAAALARLGYKVEAVDLQSHKTWAPLARRFKGRLSFKKGDASDAFPKARYDLVLAKDMLHHADDPAQVLKRMAAAVKPGGQVIVTEANRLNPVFYVHLTLLGEHEHFTLWRLRKLLAQGGLNGGRLKRVEARVWPMNRAWAQSLMGVLQDALQAFPLWWPFVCYHIYFWQRPKR